MTCHFEYQNLNAVIFRKSKQSKVAGDQPVKIRIRARNKVARQNINIRNLSMKTHGFIDVISSLKITTGLLLCIFVIFLLFVMFMHFILCSRVCVVRNLV